MITVFADKYLYEIAAFLPDKVDLHFYDPEQGLPTDNSSMDALLIRTVTKINSDTWQGIPENLQFVGTGSSGTDHVDIPFLQSHDISFADAGGCNARSVAEYVAAALLLWADDQGIDLEKKSVGIVGVGHVGTEVNKLLAVLGVKTILHDPPRTERDPNFQSAKLSEVLSADILTFHTPLTQNGDHSTLHWLDKKKLEAGPFDLVINTARGGVIDEQALLSAYDTNTVQNFVLDVWEHEPAFDTVMARNAWIKTPHIAGYSIQAKLRASKMIAVALCKHFELFMPESGKNLLNARTGRVQIDDHENLDFSDLLNQLHPIRSYDRELEKLIELPEKEKSHRFNKLRAEYPLRNEFEYLSLSEELLERYPLLLKLGFNIW